MVNQGKTWAIFVQCFETGNGSTKHRQSFIPNYPRYFAQVAAFICKCGLQQGRATGTVFHNKPSKRLKLWGARPTLKHRKVEGGQAAAEAGLRTLGQTQRKA